MMYGWSGWGMWLIGPLMMVVIVWLVVWLVHDTAGGPAQINRSTGLRNILDERFARGEIDQEEYSKRLRVLEGR